MSSEYSSSRGGRRRSSSRRGGSSSGRSRSGSSDRYEPSSSSSRTPEPKPTLIQKIIHFFVGKPAASRPSSSSSSRSRSSSSSSTGARSSSASTERSSRSSSSPTRRERPEGFRAPQIIEVTSPRVYVGNLSFDATESDLLELFNGVGQVQNVEIVTNKHTQRSKGFGFVQLTSIDEAQRAVSELHDKEYMGRKLVVSGAKAVDERRSERRAAEAPEESATEAAE